MLVKVQSARPILARVIDEKLMSPFCFKIVKSLDGMIEHCRKMRFMFLWMRILCLGEVVAKGIDYWTNDYRWIDGVCCGYWLIFFLIYQRLTAKFGARLVHAQHCRQVAMRMDCCENDSQLQMYIDQFDAHFQEL